MLMIDEFKMKKKDIKMTTKREKKRALFIAPENDPLMAYQEQFELFHYQVDVASTSQAALALKDTKYRLIIARDYVPGLNGVLLLHLFQHVRYPIKTYILVENDVEKYKRLYQKIVGLSITDVFEVPLNGETAHD